LIFTRLRQLPLSLSHYAGRRRAFSWLPRLSPRQPIDADEARLIAAFLRCAIAATMLLILFLPVIVAASADFPFDFRCRRRLRAMSAAVPPVAIFVEPARDARAACRRFMRCPFAAQLAVYLPRRLLLSAWLPAAACRNHATLMPRRLRRHAFDDVSMPRRAAADTFVADRCPLMMATASRRRAAYSPCPRCRERDFDIKRRLRCLPLPMPYAAFSAAAATARASAFRCQPPTPLSRFLLH